MHRDRVKGPKRPRLSFQRTIQLLAAVLFNGYAAGFLKGRIFTGGSKAFCVPVLNCYSCPGALGPAPSVPCRRSWGTGAAASPSTCWGR